MHLTELLGRFQGELGVDHFQVGHFLVYRLCLVACRHPFLAVHLLEDGDHVARHVYRGDDRVYHGRVVVHLDAHRIGALLTKHIRHPAEEALARLDHFYDRTFLLYLLWGLGVHDDGVFSFVEALHLLVQVVFACPFLHGLRELLQIGLFCLEQRGHHAVSGLSLADIFPRGVIDGKDRFRVAIDQSDGQEQHDGHGAITGSDLEGDCIAVHDGCSVVSGC